MEAIMIAGVAVVTVGGFYSALDLLADLGIYVRMTQTETKNSSLSGKCVLTSQRRIKKVAGMHV